MQVSVRGAPLFGVAAVELHKIHEGQDTKSNKLLFPLPREKARKSVKRLCCVQRLQKTDAQQLRREFRNALLPGLISRGLND